MIDLTAIGVGILIGMFIGTFVCVVVGVFNSATMIERIAQLTHENENLKRRQPARDSHGRYIRDSKDIGG